MLAWLYCPRCAAILVGWCLAKSMMMLVGQSSLATQSIPLPMPPDPLRLPCISLYKFSVTLIAHQA